MRALLTLLSSVATTTCCSFCSMSESCRTVQRPGLNISASGMCSWSEKMEFGLSKRESRRHSRPSMELALPESPRSLASARGRQLAERLREEVEHLLRSALGQEVLHVGLREGREAHLDALVREDL